MKKKKKDKASINRVPIAIIGMGCMFPKADSLGAYWVNIKNGVDAITDIPESHWRAEDYFDKDPKKADHTYAKRGGFLPPYDFNPLEFGMPPNAIEATDTAQLLGMVVAKQALLDAGYGPNREFDRDRISVIVGATVALELVIALGARLGHPKWRAALRDAGIEGALADDVVRRIGDSYVSWQEASFPGLLGNVIAGRIASHLDLHGTNCAVDAACASSLSAIHLAILELESGRSDMVISGGADAFNGIFMYMCFSKTPALSPSGDARSFDRNGDGTSLGEGIGMLALKRLEDAERDGDKIYAVLCGVGSSSDGKGKAIYEPSAEGQVRALQEVYQVTEISPSTVGLVEAHGTGTAVGDATEVKALTEVYRGTQSDKETKGKTWCALGSIKSQIGHTKAAAGVAGLIKVVMALHHKVLPPTIKVRQPLEALAAGKTPFYVNTVKRPWISQTNHPRRAAVSSFGFGGSNFHCVLEEYSAEKREVDWDGNVQIIPFSAENSESLINRLDNWPVDLSWKELRWRAAQERKIFNAKDSSRLLLVVERDRTDLERLFASARVMLKKSPEESWQTPEKAFYGYGSTPGKLAMLFPGQGAQYVGMLRELSCQFPQMQQVLTRANKSLEALSDLIYPYPVFSEEEKTIQEDTLRGTQIAQPAIGAVSVGALRILEYFGVKPAVVAGHSYGELVALCASGCIEEEDLHRLSKIRGELMAAGKEDRGGMLAVQASLEELESIIKEEELHLVIANRNAPRQMVLSGFTADIERAADILTKQKISHTRLSVSAAFHSSLVADAKEPFEEALQKIKFISPKIPVFSNSTAKAYPKQIDKLKKILSEQLMRPVEFLKEIENMKDSGVRTFLEVGPGCRLSNLVKTILGTRDIQAIAIDASEGKRFGSYDLACALAQIAARGHEIQLSRWDEAAEKEEVRNKDDKPVMTIPICGANYVSPKKSDPPRACPSEGRSASFAEAGVSAAKAELVEALRVTQENMMALQKMQEQTAEMHRKYLEGQDKAQQNLQSLIEQQQQLFGMSSGIQEPVDSKSIPKQDVCDVPAPEKMTLEDVSQAEVQTDSIPSAGNKEKVVEVLIAAVSEKTGYPVEMLNLEMGLDSELGIDSIKRVEILSVVQEKLPEAPEVKPEHLGTLKTLGDIVTFLVKGSEDSPSQKPEDKPLKAEIVEPIAPAQAPVAVVGSIVKRVALDKKTLRDSISLEPESEFWITDDESGIACRVAKCLRILNFHPKIVSYRKLPILAEGAMIGGLIILAPQEGMDDAFLQYAYKLSQRAAPGLRRSAKRGGAIFATLSRLDGSFGLSQLNEYHEPLSGALAGLVKTAHHEWPDVHCKALDLANDIFDREKASAEIVDEMFLSGPLEVGISDEGLSSVELSPMPIESGKSKVKIGADDVFVISGGARGVTAEVSVALARSFQSKVILLGRSPEPSDEPDWLKDLTDEADIKKAIVSHDSTQLTPKELETEYRQIAANREIIQNMERIKDAGAKVLYRSVDIRDEKRMRTLMRELQQKWGTITGLIHGAGVIADSTIEDKTDEQFERVFSTKITGLRSLLRTIDLENLKTLVLFSSSTARFGRKGQADYAMANEVLNKTAQHFQSLHTDCRVISMNWGPWDGGMVTPELKKIFSKEGVGLIPLQEGAEYLIQELSRQRDNGVEIVVLAESQMEVSQEIKAMNLAFQRTLDIEHHAFLRSHVMGGHAVLPMAIIVEWLAHGALHNNPGLFFSGFNDLRILKEIVVSDEKPITISVLTEKGQKRDLDYIVPVELHSDGKDGKKNVHARAEIVLINQVPKQKDARSDSLTADFPIKPYAKKNGDIYQEFLFHGPSLQGIQQVEGCSDEGIIATTISSPAPSAWIDQPLRSDWLADPLVLDCSFQMMILWSFEQHHAGSFPSAARSYRQYRRDFPKDGVRIVAHVTKDTEHSATADIEFFDRDRQLIARMEGYECVIDESLNKAFHRNRLAQAGSSQSKDSRHVR